MARAVMRNTLGWPVGAYSYTTKTDGLVHKVTKWWDDDLEEVRIMCDHNFMDGPDEDTRQLTCFWCIALSVDVEWADGE